MVVISVTEKKNFRTFVFVLHLPPTSFFIMSLQINILFTTCFLSLLFSFLEFPIPNSIAFIGEIGLGGELRQVSISFQCYFTIALIFP